MTSLSGRCDAFRAYLVQHPRDESFSKALDVQKNRLLNAIEQSFLDHDEGLRCIANVKKCNFLDEGTVKALVDAINLRVGLTPI